MMRIEAMSLSICLATAHPKNPKGHDINGLIGSFRRFGFVAPPTIDEKTGLMVAGHGRCEALAQLRDSKFPVPEGIGVGPDGEWMVPVVRGVSFRTDRERDAYVIADNQHVIAGGWDMDKLTAMLTDIGEDSGFDGIGFDAADLRALGLAADEMIGEGKDGEKPINVGGHKRKRKSDEAAGGRGELHYRIIIACRDEKHQAELLERFDAEKLDAKPQMV